MGRPPRVPEAKVIGRVGRRARLTRSARARGTAAAISLRRTALPGVSGRMSALALVTLFVGSSIVVPIALHRVRWVEAEAVLAVWFIIWAVGLTWLGHSGRTVERDWGPYRPLLNLSSDSGRWLGSDFGSSGGSDAGCAALIVGLLIVLALLLAIDWGIPFVVIVLYQIVYMMLNRVGRRAHETKGNLALALGRGVFWAAIFTGPLALAVWAIHILA